VRPLDLRRLDRRVLPGAARRLRDALDAVASTRRRGVDGLRTAWRGTARTVLAWAQCTDERFAATGPLARLRRAPHVALVLVAAVLLSGAAATLRLTDPQPDGAASTQQDEAAPASVGPPPGADVDDHFAAAGARLEELAQRRPDDTFLALVSLSRYLPVAEVGPLTDGLGLQRVHLRAPQVVEGETAEVPIVAGETSVLPALCAATASRRADEAESLRASAASLEPTTAEQQALRAGYEAQAAASRAEAEAYGGECATAFGAVVEGSARRLRGLLDHDAVRGVEVAPVGVALLDLDVRTTPPEGDGRLTTGATG
jgi:hypothetical protein